MSDIYQGFWLYVNKERSLQQCKQTERNRSYLLDDTHNNKWFLNAICWGFSTISKKLLITILLNAIAHKYVLDDYVIRRCKIYVSGIIRSRESQIKIMFKETCHRDSVARAWKYTENWIALFSDNSAYEWDVGKSMTTDAGANILYTKLMRSFTSTSTYCMLQTIAVCIVQMQQNLIHLQESVQRMRTKRRQSRRFPDLYGIFVLFSII